MLLWGEGWDFCINQSRNSTQSKIFPMESTQEPSCRVLETPCNWKQSISQRRCYILKTVSTWSFNAETGFQHAFFLSEPTQEYLGCVVKTDRKPLSKFFRTPWFSCRASLQRHVDGLKCSLCRALLQRRVNGWKSFAQAGSFHGGAAGICCTNFLKFVKAIRR